MRDRTPGQSRVKLPSGKDFDPWKGNLDAQCAWKNFGGLDLDSAFQKFLENPLNYQEDFMFMGPVAFNFYFPVIDRYLREIHNDDELGDCEAWILGKAIETQMEEGVDEALLGKIGDLSRYVRTHLAHYSPIPKEQKRIDKAWRLIEEKLSKRQR